VHKHNRPSRVILGILGLVIFLAGVLGPMSIKSGILWVTATPLASVIGCALFFGAISK